MKLIALVTLSIISFIGLSQKKENTLIYNAFDIQNNDDYSSFAMMDSVVENYSVFFIGENHKYRISNSRQQLKMLKYLHKQTGVKHIFMEFGYSRGFLVNEYIHTGDSTILKGLENFTYEEYSDFYKELYEYNQTLEEGNKISIHGIDLERSFLTGIKLIRMMMPEKEKTIPKEISLTVETIISLDGYNTSIWEEYKDESSSKNSGTLSYSRYYGQFNQTLSLKGILENFTEFEDLYKLYYGVNFEIVERVMHGLKCEQKRLELDGKKMIQGPIYREDFMFTSFMELVENNPGEKFFGEFGRCHTSPVEFDKWCNYYHFKSLATRIQNSDNSDVSGRVMSVATYYPNEEAYSNIYGDFSALNVCNTLKGTDVNLVYVNNDSNYFDETLQSFRFLIINNNTLYEEFQDKKVAKVESGWKKDGTANDYIHFDALYGFSNLRLKNLNNRFSDLNLATLNNTQITYGGALTVYSAYNLFNRFSYLRMEPYKGIVGDTASLSLTSNQFMWHVGGNLSDLEMFSMSPNIGFGYQQMKLTINDWYNNESAITGELFTNTLDPKNDLVYRNGAFLIDFGLDTRINVKFISIGLFGGYQLDPSFKKWWLNGSISQESPKTSLSGWHAHASLSLFLHQYY